MHGQPSFRLLLAAASLAATPFALAADGDVTDLVTNGSSANRVDIVFLGDGYTSAQQGTYATNVQTMIDYLFTPGALVDPLPRYANFFNIHRVEVNSAQSGADNDNAGTYVDTALDAHYYGADGRLLGINTTKANALLPSSTGNGGGFTADMRIVTVNSPTYGGLAQGDYATFAAGSGSFRDGMLHEIGHAFVKLGDEYGDNAAPYSGTERWEVNLTTDQTGSKWERWLGYNDPNTGVVGAYEGGGYHELGIYRPSLNSKMQNLGRAFDPIGKEAFISKIYNHVRPLDAHTANGAMLTDPSSLWVESVDAAVFTREWYVDGVLVAGATGENFDIASFGITDGLHRITSRVYDDTDMVRDPAVFAKMIQTVNWLVKTGNTSSGPSPVWTNLNGGAWSDAANWFGAIADGIDALADFTYLDLTASRTVTLDSNRTVGTLKFNDYGDYTGLSVGALEGAWTIASTGGAKLTLETSSGQPIIDLGLTGFAGGFVQHTIGASLRGTNGFKITGNNQVVFNTGSLTGITGTATITGGRMALQGNDLGGLTAIDVKSGGQIALGNSGVHAQNFSLAGTGYGETGYAVALRGANSGQTVQLNGAVTLTGDTSVGSAAGGITNFNGGIGQSGGGFGLTVGDTGLTGLVVLNGVNTYTGNTTIAYGTLKIGGAGSLGAGDYAGDIRNAGSLNFASSANQMLSGVLSGAGTLVKSGTGTLTLSGNNTYTGATTVNGGLLSLDYRTSNTDKVASGAALTFGGGTLSVIGHGSADTTQSVAGTTINAGASAVTVTKNAAANNASLHLNTITRSLGGTLNVAYAGTGAGVATVTTDNLNDATGILGGWATFGGTGWAKNGVNTADGAIVAYSGYTADTWAAGNNTDVSATGSVAADSVTNSLRINTAAPTTLTLAGVNTLTSGGLLVGPGVGNNATLITGGSLSGSASGELIVQQHNTANALTIASAIADNTGATALTKSGAGTLALTGTNTYTGETWVSDGTLSISSNANLGAVATGARLNLSEGTTLKTTATFALDNAGANKRAINLLGSATIDTAASTTLTVGGVISGDNALTKTGTGTLLLSGVNTFTGATIVNAGTLSLDGLYGALRNSASITVNAGASLRTKDTWYSSEVFSSNGTAWNAARMLTVDGGTVNLLKAAGRLGNITLKNGATFTTDTLTVAANGTGWAPYGTTLADVSTGASTVTVAGTSASSMTGALNIRGIQNFDVGDVTNSSATDLTVSTVLSNYNGTPGGFNKLGAGTMVLSGNSTYTGGTTINAGTVRVAGNAALGTGAVTVNSGGTLNTGLAGSNHTLANAVTVNSGGRLMGAGTHTGSVTLASGATLAPGNSPGITTLSAGGSFANGSVYEWEIQGAAPSVTGTDFDRITVTGGALTVDAGAILKISAAGIDYAGAFWDANRSFTYALASGGTITGSFTMDTSLAGLFAGQGSWSLSASSGNLLANWTAIPEPSTYGLIGAGALAAVAFVRRRRAKPV
jgi:autotransporter-associated beta strand protein